MSLLVRLLANQSHRSSHNCDIRNKWNEQHQIFSLCLWMSALTIPCIDAPPVVINYCSPRDSSSLPTSFPPPHTETQRQTDRPVPIQGYYPIVSPIIIIIYLLNGNTIQSPTNPINKNRRNKSSFVSNLVIF